MSTGNPLEQLRRRMQSHATPTAFAALAEEHRRAGRFEEAIAVCRDGLARYPAYVSARVTLGRALLDSGDVAGALTELEQAVAQAPDNLAAARALESAHTAIGNAPPPPPLPELSLHPAPEAETAPFEPSAVAQALAGGPDGPQEFGLAPDWSIPQSSAATDDSAAVGAGDATAAAADAVSVEAYDHAEAPTMQVTPQHLQGEEPAGIWPVPESEAVPAHDSPDAARVFSWALDPPAGGEAEAATTSEMSAASASDASVWDTPTMEAPLGAVQEAGAGINEWFAPETTTTAPEVEASSEAGEPGDLTVVVAASDFAADVTPAEPTSESSPFWTGAFGGEPQNETPAPFSGWGDDAPAIDAGADRSPWASDTKDDASEAWATPDGPSATWALGDLHESAGADATPFADVVDAVIEPTAPAAFASVPAEEGSHAPSALLESSLPEVAAQAAEVEAEAQATDAEEPTPSEVAWAGSVKSALGEVFALAGQESAAAASDTPTGVRAAMAETAVEAAIEDAVLRDDAPPATLVSLQQMLDAVRARRAALFNDVRS